MDKKPIYVKIDKYKEVLEVVTLIQKKIEQARGVLGKINQLKNQEDSELESWKTDLDEMEKRIGSIADLLQEPET